MFGRKKTTNNVQNAIFQEALAISVQDGNEAKKVALQQDEIFNSLKALQDELKKQIAENF